jgi:hypothetical protein
VGAFAFVVVLQFWTKKVKERKKGEKRKKSLP